MVVLLFWLYFWHSFGTLLPMSSGIAISRTSLLALSHSVFMAQGHYHIHHTNYSAWFCSSFLYYSKYQTRSSPVCEARRNDAPLNLEIYADILCVISVEFASNPGRIIRLVWTCFTHFHAVFNSILQLIGSN